MSVSADKRRKVERIITKTYHSLLRGEEYNEGRKLRKISFGGCGRGGAAAMEGGGGEGQGLRMDVATAAGGGLWWLGSKGGRRWRSAGVGLWCVLIVE